MFSYEEIVEILGGVYCSTIFSEKEVQYFFYKLNGDIINAEKILNDIKLDKEEKLKKFKKIEEVEEEKIDVVPT